MGRKPLIQEFYHITFTIGIFWLLVIEHFFKAHGQDNTSAVIIGWANVIALYIFAYIIYIMDRRLIIQSSKYVKLIESVQLTNLFLIGILIVITGTIDDIDKWNNYWEYIVTTFYGILLFFVGYIMPVLFIIMQIIPIRKQIKSPLK